MEGLVTRLIDLIRRSVPPRIAARIDALRPGLAEGFGPFNGQRHRQAILRSVLRSCKFDLVIEAGTYRGTTTEYLRGLTPAPIITIEVSERFYHYARRRLSKLADVRIIHGDSPMVIRRIASRPSHDPHAQVFAYLDAHWGRNLPTRFEILELLSGWESVCMVIDDFKVPGDPGYGYDDYGRGFAVDTALLSGLPLANVSMFLPRIASSEETGNRRGWVVLARGDGLIEQLSQTDGLVLERQWAEPVATST